MAQLSILSEPPTSGAHAPGKRFVDWHPVGAGGSSDVYKVFDTELGISLAIKILKQAHRADKRYIESLRREVLISRQLRHSNICPIHDLYEGDRGVGIVMDLIEGHDLKQWLRDNRGTLLESVAKRVALFAKLSSALDVAHSLIIHRDLKPANIFLRRNDIADPVIMDFGLSTPDNSDATLQLEGGTPKYMAPEQFLRLTDIDQRADLYALGVLAYELLTDGQIPLCSLKDVAKTGVLPQFRPEDVVPPSAFCAAIPPELDRLVLSMLEHDRERRPATASEVKNVLDRVVLLDPFRPVESKDVKSRAVVVNAGSYVVGEKNGGRSVDQPQKKIKLDTFKIAISPVTNADYRRFLTSTGYRPPELIEHPLFGADLNPVVMVNWDDASAYARWAGARLPTELEWEVAAKAGNPANFYPWGGEKPQVTQANLDNVCHGTTPVGSYSAGNNSLGMTDCCGNVWEWCADSWDENLLKGFAADSLNPCSQTNSDLRAVRGGSFDTPLAASRLTFRRAFDRSVRRAELGFRLVFGS